MTELERLLPACRGPVERYVKFRVASPQDAEDVLQEIFLAAARHAPSFRDERQAKAWLLGVARHKCADYYRARRPETPMDALAIRAVEPPRVWPGPASAVRETLARLSPADRQALYLFYWLELPQAEIARKLGVPVGTVKSRLHAARRRFRALYPRREPTKGAAPMKQLPKMLPDYAIVPSDLPPFPVRWEEMMGWFIVPKLGETLTWGMYDFPERALTEWDEMRVVGRAEVHGIEGVEITATAHNPMACNAVRDGEDVERRFVAQLTDTHCRMLAESHMEDGVKRCFTFLDGPAFLDNWGFGEDNRGNEIDPRPKGDVTRVGDQVTAADKPFLLDVVGRYTVTIGQKQYDTICVMDVSTYLSGAVTEQYLDREGRTVLWRRFNADDWHLDRYGQHWSERFPDNERLWVNGKLYVHWYDCITSHIL